jgi:hypothetical protein
LVASPIAARYPVKLTSVSLQQFLVHQGERILEGEEEAEIALLSEGDRDVFEIEMFSYVLLLRVRYDYSD